MRIYGNASIATVHLASSLHIQTPTYKLQSLLYVTSIWNVLNL